MKALAAISIGVAGLWLANPTYDQIYGSPWALAGQAMALIVFSWLIVGGLFAVARNIWRACP